ncbi:MAG: tetratricopeptide repeat protein [Jatrophihabitans sp.]
MSSSAVTQLQRPQPLGIGDAGALAARLDELRCWSGLSIRALHLRVVAQRRKAGVVELPSYNTVWRCLQPGRARLDTDLVADVVRALTADESAVALWRQACATAAARHGDAQLVETSATLPSAEQTSFVGRQDALDSIAAAGRNDTPAVVRIDGMPGVGKTWLAAEAARRAAAGGVDVVLTASLRGYHIARAPADPYSVLGEFLRHLAAPPDLVATLDLRGRRVHLRRLLRGQRVLVLLDDAADEEQVRPLLPGTPGSLTLVTSRRKLVGLPGRRLALGAFTPAESCVALSKAVEGRGRDTDDASVAELAAAVGHLPLAVGLVARYVGIHPDWTLRDHIDRLKQASSAGRVEEPIDLALAASYRALSDQQQHLARLVALHPAQVDPWSAAALAGTKATEAARQLDVLCQANVISEHDGSYVIHDLFRVFLTARSWDEDAPATRHAAWTRLVRYYVQTALAGATATGTQPVAVWSDWAAGADVPTFDAAEPAREWLQRERATLLAIALRADSIDGQAPAVALSAALARYLGTSGFYREARLLHARAVTVASEADLARALTSLGASEWRLGELDNAAGHLRRAVASARRRSDGRDESRALNNLGIVYGAHGRWDQALAANRRALVIARRLGVRADEANVLHNLGYVCERLEKHELAGEYFSRARALADKEGDAELAAKAALGLARTLEMTGEYAQATEIADEQLVLARRFGHRVVEASADVQLARLRRIEGDLVSAAVLTETALGIARDVGYRAMQEELESELATLRSDASR